MAHWRSWSIGLCVVLLTAACTQGERPRSREAPAISASAPSGPKTLTLAYETEPLNLVLQMVGQFGSQGGTELHLAVHQRLSSYDDRGGLHPMLAVELPSQDRGTWVVRPDGTMQTTYRLRPKVTWHDGTALTSRDVAFAWTVTSDPAVPTSQKRISQQIDRIETPDPLTAVIEWKGAYPFANAITEEDLGPLPVHLLGSLYASDKERFPQSPYWAYEFVGVGPFRLAEWQAGSHLVLAGYEGFFAGPPKVDRIVVRFIEDDSAAVAQLLAGTVDGDIAETIQFGQATFVKREWERAGRTPTLFVQPTKWRFLFAQFRNPRLPEILDARVRRGLLHGIDREELVSALLEGLVPVSHSMVSPTDPKDEWVNDVVSRYPYDPREAERLLLGAGWRRGPDGAMVDQSGQRVTVPVSTQPGDTNAQELSIIADYWRRLGLDVQQANLTRAEVRDTRYLVSFPGFLAAQIPSTFSNLMARVHGPNCPTEETRWVGSSWGCYQNPDMDVAIEGLKQAIDPGEQRRLWRDLVRIQSQELPVLPLYFNATVSLFREGVTGVRGHSIPKTSITWNIAEWDLR